MRIKAIKNVNTSNWNFDNPKMLKGDFGTITECLTGGSMNKIDSHHLYSIQPDSGKSFCAHGHLFKDSVQLVGKEMDQKARDKAYQHISDELHAEGFFNR